MTRPAPTTRAAVAAFLAGVFTFRPGLLATVLSLQIVQGLAEAATFTLLSPWLASVGVVDLSGPGGWLVGMLTPLGTFAGPAWTLEITLGMFLCVMLARAALAYASTALSCRYVTSYAEHARTSLYRALSRARWLYLASTRNSRDMHALTLQVDSFTGATSNVFMLASSLFMIVSGVGLAFLVSPRLTATVLAAGFVFIGLFWFFQTSAWRRGLIAYEAMQRVYDRLEERMGAVKLAKAFAIERLFERDFSKASEDYRRAIVAQRDDDARARLVLEIGAAVILMIFVYASVRLFASPGVDTIMLIVIFARLFPLASSAPLILRSLVGAMPDYVAVKQLESGARAAEELIPEVATRIGLANRLELRGVSFSHLARLDAPILLDVNLVVPAGSSMGIIGLSGSGKSTLADIMAGLIAPSAGEILIDGVALTPDSRPHWRCGVAYVPQDAPLFHDTIRANLTIGAREATDADIWRCLELAHAAHVVRALPDGLDSVAGDRGMRLSGGECQRIRLASALLREPELLILDEATSALSPLDEQEIIAALTCLTGSMTIIMIAHRPSSIAWTDRLVVLNDGNVASVGVTAELMADQGDPASPWRMSK